MTDNKKQLIAVYLRSLGYFVQKLESPEFPQLYCIKNGNHFFVQYGDGNEEKHKQIRLHGGKVYSVTRVQEIKMIIKK